RLKELVEGLGGELMGDGEIEVSGIAPLDRAGASDLTCLSTPKLPAQARATRAAALILSPTDHAALTDYSGVRIVTANPYAYFARAAQWFEKLRAVPPVPGIHQSACVAPDARVADSACIGPHVTIEAGAEIAE